MGSKQNQKAVSQWQNTASDPLPDDKNPLDDGWDPDAGPKGAMTLIFPVRMNGYTQKRLLSRTIHLGPSADAKLFSVTEYLGIVSRPLIELHDGSGRELGRLERGKGVD